MPPRRIRRLLCAWLLTLAVPAWAAASLLWFDAGRPNAAAAEAVAILSAAADDGLDPQDYDAQALRQAVARAQQALLPEPAAQARLDAALSAALQRYLSDLHNGRVAPRQIHARFAVPKSGWEPSTEFLARAVAEHRLSQAVRQIAPQLPMYERLRQALASYRRLGEHSAWREPLPPLPARKIESGQVYAGLAQLMQRLQATGDLSTDAESVPAQLQEPLVSALRRFQERHGLAPDAVLGPATLQQLNVTPGRRVRQITLALERLRWTPYLLAPRMVVVNIPEFTLRAYEVHNGQVDVKLSMKVIVGKALDTRTPLFSEDMRFIEFSPYWNVPPSIAQKELVPRLRREPAYFQQQGFEFVGANGQVVTTLAAAYLDAVMAGSWRIRQRPGPLNALGDIKFIFPNNEHIYLHHTPAPQLFQRERRDFSHGCIRVESPVDLARFVLQDQPGWSAERIQAAMEKGESSTLALTTPLPVLVAYSTVVVKGGRVFFYPDLYGHDQLLEQALRQHSASHTPARLIETQAE